MAKIEALIVLGMLALAIWGGHLSAENQEAEVRLRRARCANGVWDPCDLHCRTFIGVITNSDGCDCPKE